MKYLSANLLEIKNRLSRSDGSVLMLDFDGTLSPLVSTPDKAKIDPGIKEELKKIIRLFPIVIISGRELGDLEKKIGLKNISLAGNHGFEWRLKNEKGSIKIPRGTRSLLLQIKKELVILTSAYPGVLLEDKGLGLAVHYRRLRPGRVASFKKGISKIVSSPDCGAGLSEVRGKKVIELVPRIKWDKGNFARLAMEKFKKSRKLKLLPVYIGDDTTDESAFMALRNSGETIKVGKGEKSRAEFYVKNLKQVELFLKWLRAEAERDPKRATNIF